MKHFHLLIICFFSLFTFVCKAQEIASGPQLQGGISSKNMSVDYATGILHYKLPLFDLQSRNYTLPISLDYTAQGVRRNDRPGIAGFNWSLSAGGFISRTVRGIPDEYQLLYRMLDTLNPDIMNGLNYKAWDGEADIFTAVFNRKSIRFILNKSGSQLVAEPLEQTSVRITCLLGQNQITGWEITDDDGCKYLFKEMETIKNYRQESDASTANISLPEYTSAWYMTSITMPDKETIYLSYTSGDSFFLTSPANFPGFKIIDEQWVRYDYGRPLTEYPFNFNKYQDEYESCMEQACALAAGIQQQNYIDEWRKNKRYIMDFATGKFIKNKLYEETSQLILENLKFQQKVMGILTDLNEVTQVSLELIGALNQLIYQFEGTGIDTHIANAKECVKRALEDYQIIWDKSQFIYSFYYLKSPYVTRIYNRHQSVYFHYSLSSDQHPCLISAELYQDNRLKEKVNLSMNGTGTLLKQMERQTEEKRICERLQFSYFHEDTPYTCLDNWGYHTFRSNPGAHRMDINPIDSNYVKKYSLQQIINGKGGKIKINYEPNTTDVSELPSKWFGGIRLKELAVTDEGGVTNLVRYRYPVPGIFVYDSLSSFDLVRYEEVTDVVTHSLVRNIGKASVNTGNNGLYYPYVQEVFSGKGMNAYSFSVVPGSEQNTEHSYPWWLSGVLLGKATYNEAGNLICVTKNKYYATTELSPYFYGKECFEPLAGKFVYNRSFLEGEPYPYYVNMSVPTGKYELIYEDYPFPPLLVNPYANLACRQKSIIPASFKPYSRFYYGGKTVLKEQDEYLFNPSLASGPASPDHILYPVRLSGTALTKHTEYKYDNASRNTAPTQVICNESNGDKTVTVRYSPLEFTDQASPVIQQMKAANVLAPLLKEQKWVSQGGSDDYRLTHEIIHEYEAYSFPGGNKIFLPAKEYTLCPDILSLFSFSLSFPFSSLYSCLPEQYVLEQKFQYKSYSNEWFPESVANKQDKTSIWYDPKQKLEMMQASALENSQGDARSGYLNYVRYYKIIDHFCRNVAPEIPNSDFALDYNCDFLPSFVKFMSQLLFIDTDVLLYFREDIKKNYVYMYNFEEYFMRGLSFSNFTQSDFEILKETLFFLMNASSNELDQYVDAFEDYPDLQELISSSDLLFGKVKLHTVPVALSYKVYLYVKPSASALNVDYSYVKNGQLCSFQHAFQVTPGNYTLLTFDIVLPADGNISELNVNLPETARVISGVLVPTGNSFNALGYTADRKVLCRFDQNGNLERYEYDDAGRVLKVFDRDNNLLLENKYNDLFTK